MIKKNPQLNKNKGNKSIYRGKSGASQFSIKKVNENQQRVLMIINKPILLRNRNGYRFHSHQSTANLKSRTQSTTIPNFANPNRLYIYIKRGLCWFANSSQVDVDRVKRSWHIGYIDTNTAY